MPALFMNIGTVSSACDGEVSLESVCAMIPAAVNRNTPILALDQFS